MTRNYIRFTGKYGDLKKQWGFGFQRLYANNYMQWCNGDVRVWKKGGDVTVDGWTNYEYPMFCLFMNARRDGTKLEVSCGHIPIYAEREGDGVITEDVYKAKLDACTDPDGRLAVIHHYFAIYVKPETLALLTRMVDAGMIEDPTMTTRTDAAESLYN